LSVDGPGLYYPTPGIFFALSFMKSINGFLFAFKKYYFLTALYLLVLAMASNALYEAGEGL